MKKSFSILVVVAVAMFNVLAVNAQKSDSFAGTVKFSVKYEGDINPKDHTPHEEVYTIFGNKLKAIRPPYQVLIFDGNTVTATVLYDIPINKCGYKASKEYIEADQETKNYTYKKSEETKTICGYVCTRYDVTIYDTEDETEETGFIYTTTEIGESSDINAFDYPGLTGFPLYQEMVENGAKTIKEAIEVKPTKVKSMDFLIPSGNKMIPNGGEWSRYINAWQEGMKEE
jgi:hypothetical protein